MIDSYKKNLLHRLKITRGHLDKVIEMVEGDRYCLDVIQQTQAIGSSLGKITNLILENHLKTCVRQAMVADKNVDEKVKEIITVLQRRKI